jgi:hypothetical protein
MDKQPSTRLRGAHPKAFRRGGLSQHTLAVLLKERSVRMPRGSGPVSRSPAPARRYIQRASFQFAGCLKHLSNPARPADICLGLSSLFFGGRGSRSEASLARLIFPEKKGSVPGPRFQPFSALRKPEIQSRGRAATRARGTPERSGTTRRTASPAASKIAVTSSAWPAPSSMTADPPCVKTSGRAAASAL